MTPAFDKYQILLQSHFNSTDISRILETDFDKSVFIHDENLPKPVKNLFNYIDIMGSEDLWLYKDISIKEPEPLRDDSKEITYNVSSGVFCERPAYFPKVNKGEISYIYPLGSDDLYRIKTDIYLGSNNTVSTEETSDIPIIRSVINNSKRPFESYNKDYSLNSSFSTDVATSYLGSSSTKSTSINNLAKYKDGKSSWESNWTNANTTVISDNIFFANDTIKVTPVNNLKETDYTDFDLKVSNLEEGTYCFSFYVRTDDKKDIQLEDGEYIEDVDNRYSDVTDNSGFYCLSWIQLITDKSINVKYVLHRGIEYFPDDMAFRVDSLWRRICICFETESLLGDSITFTIRWLQRYDKQTVISNRNVPLKICGILLEKSNTPSIYDKRYISYSNSIASEPVYHPLALYLGESIEEEGDEDILKNNSWTINYKRFIESAPSSEVYFMDSIGNISYGLYKNTVIIRYIDLPDGKTDYTIASKEIDVNYFYNTLESVFVSYEKSSKLFTIKSYTENGSYEISAFIEPDNWICKFIDEETEESKYHLLLGGTDTKNFTPGYYSDVFFLNRYLMSDEITKMRDSYFAESISKYRYGRDTLFVPEEGKSVIQPISWNDLKNKESEDLFDRKNASSVCYKLTSDSNGLCIGDDEPRYKKDDILFCIKKIENKLNIEDIPRYWSRTLFYDVSEDKTEEEKDTIASVFRAPLIIEGFEKIIEKGNKLISKNWS